MKLTIFAATGGIGRQALEQAVAAGHDVTAIVQAMKATGVRRIVGVLAAPISTVPSPGSPKPPKHDPGDGFFISRADVAHLMLCVLEQPETMKQAIGIAYSCIEEERGAYVITT